MIHGLQPLTLRIHQRKHMNIRTSIFLSLAILWAFQSVAQKPAVKSAAGTAFFEQTSFNFGMINEQNGNVKARFVFKNIGRKPLLIKNVESPCGCTVPMWPKEPVQPGESGAIDAEFEPLNRVGEFSKTLTVVTDGDPTYVYLNIKGEVYSEKIEIRQSFPFKQGNMRFSKYDLKLKPMYENMKDSVVFSVYNSSKRDMLISHIETPSHITTKVYQNIIPAGNATDIVYYFDAAASKDLGPHTDQTFIYTTDDTLAKKIVTLHTQIEQNFGMLVPEVRKNPPAAAWKSISYDYGEVYLGEIVTYEFEVQNKGKSPLLIRKAQPSCGCTVTSFTTEPIKKGKSGKVKVVFNAKGLRGMQDKSVTVYTNDPANPITTLKIRAKVVIPGVDPISGK